MRAEHFRRRKQWWFIAGQRLKWLLTLTLILALASAADLFVSRRNHASTAVQAISPGDSGVVESAEIPKVRSERTFYLYSVIPGGVRSIQELKNAIAADPVVSAHYATFHLERARLIRLDRERSMHVSYRLGNEIFWTKRELTVKKGESLITDGVQTARTRCGNLVSETVAAAVYANEPPVEELDEQQKTPFSPGELEGDDRFPDLELAPVENVPPPAGSAPIGRTDPIGHGTSPPGPGPAPVIFLPPVSPGPIPYPTKPRRPPVVNAPEPGTGIQLLVSVMVMIFLLIRWPKRALEGFQGKR
jgi:hypothetical protein